MSTVTNESNHKNFETLNFVLGSPAIAAMTYTLPKALDPESNFVVSFLAGFGTRLLLLTQSVILAAALPFAMLYGLFSVWFQGDSIASISLPFVFYSALLSTTLFAAAAPQSSLSSLRFAEDGEVSLGSIFEALVKG